MSLWKPTYLLCDHDGCKAWLQGDEGTNGNRMRKAMGANGWSRRDRGDYCPDHSVVRRKTMYRHAASLMVQEAIDLGEMSRGTSCDVCGSAQSIVGHHDDYAKPLDVRWLCHRCHRAWHQEHGPGAHAFIEAAP